MVTLADVIKNQQTKLWHKLLPTMLFLSFVVANIYNAILLVNTYELAIGTLASAVIYHALIFALISYLLYKFMFWLYSLFLNRSVYAMCIPYIIFKDQFNTIYLIKNVITGLVGVICLFIPYFMPFITVINFILSFCVIPIVFALNNGKFIPELVAHNVFRAYALPYFIYLFLDVVFLVVGVV